MWYSWTNSWECARPRVAIRVIFLTVPRSMVRYWSKSLSRAVHAFTPGFGASFCRLLGFGGFFWLLFVFDWLVLRVVSWLVFVAWLDSAGFVSWR